MLDLPEPLLQPFVFLFFWKKNNIRSSERALRRKRRGSVSFFVGPLHCCRSRFPGAAPSSTTAPSSSSTLSSPHLNFPLFRASTAALQPTCFSAKNARARSVSFFAIPDFCTVHGILQFRSKLIPKYFKSSQQGKFVFQQLNRPRSSPSSRAATSSGSPSTSDCFFLCRFPWRRFSTCSHFPERPSMLKEDPYYACSVFAPCGPRLQF